MITVHHSVRTALPQSASHRSMMTRLLNAISVQRQRRKLAALDDAALDDIGITRIEALQEAARPFWDAPSHWHG